MGSSLSREYGSCFGRGGGGRRRRWWEKWRAVEGKAPLRCLMFGLSDIVEVTETAVARFKRFYFYLGKIFQFRNLIRKREKKKSFFELKMQKGIYRQNQCC